MSPKKVGLGRGLDSLIPNRKIGSKSDKVDLSKETKKEISDDIKTENEVIEKSVTNEEKDTKKEEQLIRITLISPNSDQPRKTFDESSLTELSESIKEHGVIQPIIVTKKGDLYTIIAGERRWRAAKMAGLTSIPAIVRDYAPKEAMEIAIIENIQRKDLNPIEEAMAYQSLIEEYNITQDDVAARLSKSRSVIANSLRLLTLTKKVKELLVEGLLSAGHGRSLASIKDEKSQNALADKIIKEGLTVRDVEKLLSNKTNGNASKKVSSKKIEFNDDFIYEDMVKRLEKRLGTKVKIKRATKDKGELIIEYYSPLEFEQLFKHINR